jgi:hypothetical protein
MTKYSYIFQNFIKLNAPKTISIGILTGNALGCFTEFFASGHIRFNSFLVFGFLVIVDWTIHRWPD